MKRIVFCLLMLLSLIVPAECVLEDYSKYFDQVLSFLSDQKTRSKDGINAIKEIPFEYRFALAEDFSHIKYAYTGGAEKERKRGFQCYNPSHTMQDKQRWCESKSFCIYIKKYNAEQIAASINKLLEILRYDFNRDSYFDAADIEKKKPF